MSRLIGDCREYRNFCSDDCLLLAVPLNALTPSPNDKCLILRADKSSIASATGFSKDNWPSVNNPSWGAQPFWQQDYNSAPNNTDMGHSPTPYNQAPQSDKGAEQLQEQK